MGCWETEIGSRAVAEAVGCPTAEMRRLPDYLQPGLPPPAELRALGHALGLGLGALVNIFNPELVILGGVLRWVYPLVRADVLDALRDWALEAPAAQAQIVVPSLGGDSVSSGRPSWPSPTYCETRSAVLAGAAGDAGTVLDA